ncbi:MAG: hypothetical protein AB7U82_27710 [Blastocatellales bacterium]
MHNEASLYNQLAKLGRKHGATTDRIRQKAALVELHDRFDAKNWGECADERRAALIGAVEKERSSRAAIEAEMLQVSLALASQHLNQEVYP